MTRLSLATLALALWGTLSTSGAQAQDFYQIDSGPAGHSLVAVRAWDDIRLTAVYSRWSDQGNATSVALSKSIAVEAIPTLKLALGLQALEHRSSPAATSPSDSGLGLKAGAEWQPHVAGGQGYLLLEHSSLFGSWLAVAQYKPDQLPVGIEWAAAGDQRWYVGHSVALRYAIPGTRWSVRVGQRRQDQQTFAGLNYNGF